MAEAVRESTPNDPPKIGPPIWLTLEEAFQQLRACSRSSREALNDLYSILRNDDCRSVWVSPTGALCPLSAGWWRESASPVVPFPIDGVDHVDVNYPNYAFDHIDYLSDKRGTFFVLAAAFVREQERLYPTPAAPPPAAHAVDELIPATSYNTSGR
jgi:hypothetical protein